MQKEIAYFDNFKEIFKNGFNTILENYPDAITGRKPHKLNAEDLKNDSFKRVRRLLRQSLSSKEMTTSFIVQFNIAINESITKLQPNSENRKLDDATAPSFSPNRTPQANPQSPKHSIEQKKACITPKQVLNIPTPTGSLTLFRPLFTQNDETKKSVVNSLIPMLLDKEASSSLSPRSF